MKSLNIEYLFYSFYRWLQGITVVSPSDTSTELTGVLVAERYTNFAAFFQSLFVRVVGSFLVILTTIIVVYLLIRLYEVRKDEKRRFKDYFIVPTEKDRKNDRWQQVVDLFASPRPEDWRLAILEADSMLDDLILRLGYEGDSMGERMKQVEVQNFPTIQYAWEAHLMRNKIAHEGMNFDLNRDKANRAFRLYEAVFRDSGYI